MARKDGEPPRADGPTGNPPLQREIDALREENKRQRRQIEKLEKRLARMEALILGLEDDE